MNTKLLVGTAAIALVVGAGAIAQSVRAPSRGTDEGRGTTAQSYKSPRTQAERIADVKRQSAIKKKGEREAGSVEPLPDPQAEQTAAPDTRQAAQQQAAQPNEPPRANLRTVYPNQTGPQSPQNQAAAPADQAKPPAADKARQAEQNATPPQGSGAAPAAQPNAKQSAQPPAAAPAPAASRQPAASPPKNEAAQAAPQQEATAQTAQSGSPGIVALNTQQQTQVGQAIAQHKVQPLGDVRFSIAIGTAVPRSVQLRALPADLATFVPQYRGYSYFVVEDEVVIVDPSSSKIVTILPYTATAAATARAEEKSRAAPPEKAQAAAPPPAPRRHTASRPPLQSRSVKLDTGDRDAIRSYLREHRSSSTAIDMPPKPRVRDRLERSVTIERRPEERSVIVERRPAEVYQEAPPPRGLFDFFGHRDGPRLFGPDED